MVYDGTKLVHTNYLSPSLPTMSQQISFGLFTHLVMLGKRCRCLVDVCGKSYDTFFGYIYFWRQAPQFPAVLHHYNKYMRACIHNVILIKFLYDKCQITIHLSIFVYKLKQTPHQTKEVLPTHANDHQ